MKKLLMLLAAVMSLSMAMSAQDQRVTGQVVSADDGEPLAGATVTGEGTPTGVITDIDGLFEIILPETVKRITVSYVGMRTASVAITPGIPMTIPLESDNKLDEVITVAFGTAKKSAFTGSASVVSADDLSRHVTTNVANALAGTVPGLQMRGASGAPGSNDGKINIRGISSMFADTDPLIIVDGSPYTASLSNLPQGDIESISVLKDAASAALYGARGASGVIIITTRKGTSDRARVSVDMKWGANSRADRDYDVITDPAEYFEAGYAYIYNYYTSGGTAPEKANTNANYYLTRWTGNYNLYNVPDGEKLIGMDGKINPNATKGYTYTATDGKVYYLTNDSWKDEAYRTALRQEYNVSVSGGGDRSSFYASAGYLDEGGIIEFSDYRRFTARLKTDYKVKPWLKVGLNAAYVHSRTESTPNLDQTMGSSNLMYYVNNIAPIYPVYIRTVDDNGNPVIMSDSHGLLYDYSRAPQIYGNPAYNLTIGRPFAPGDNPLGNNRYNSDSRTGNQLNATIDAEFYLSSHVKAAVSSNVIWGASRRSQYDNPFFGPKESVNGYLVKSDEDSYRTNNLQTVTYTGAWDRHSLTVLGGHEYYRSTANFLTAEASGGFSPDIQEINAFAYKVTSSSYKSTYNVEGLFASAQYDYAGKYFGSASIRRDASSHFAKGHRWGSFWSVGGAWIVNKDFLQDKKWINTLKFKLSVGQQGNDNIGNWAYTDLYQLTASSQTQMSPSFYRIGNEDVTWETTTNTNAGVEFSLFSNRLSGSVDYYYKKTTDLLFWLSVPESYGSRGYYGNIGDIRNAGIEVQLNGAIVRNRLVGWDISLNFTHNSNRILKLPASKTQNLGGFSQSDKSQTITSWYAEGGSMYQLFVPETAGLDEKGVQLYWQDSALCSTNADGVEVSLTDRPGTNRDAKTTNPQYASRYVQKSNLPKLYGGFSTSLRVGRVDMSASFDYQIGGSVFDTRYMNYMDPANMRSGVNYHKDWVNSWTPENSGSDIPRWQYGDKYTIYKSNRFITDASYLNFASFTVGYNFPSLVRGIEKMRLYCQGENLCYWSKRKGLDPRYSFTSAASVSNYNPIRNISGGIQVVF